MMDIGKKLFYFSSSSATLVKMQKTMQIQRMPKKQHQAAVTAVTKMFLKVWTRSTCRSILFDCLNNLESKVNDEIYASTNTLKENQIKNNSQTSLKQLVFFQKSFMNLKSTGSSKKKKINSLRDHLSVLHDELKKMQAQVDEQTQFS